MAANERLKGVVLAYVFLFLRNITAILLIPFIISKVGVGSYGVYSLVASIIGYLLIIELGLSNTSVRFLSKYLEAGNKVQEAIFLGKIISLYILITLVAGVLAVCFYFSLDLIFKSSLTGQELNLLKCLYLILAVNIVITLLTNSLTGIIISRERFRFISVLDIFLFVARTLLVITLLSFGFGVIAIVMVDTVINLSCGLAKFVYIKRHISIRVAFNWDGLLLKEIALYGFFISLNVVVNQINWRVDSFILGAVIDSSSVAVYNVGLQFVLAYIAVAAAVTNVFLPKFVTLVERGMSTAELTGHMIKISRYQLVMLGFFMTTYATLGSYFIKLLFGGGFQLSFVSSVIVMVPFTLVLTQSTVNCILQAMNLHKVKSVVLLLVAFFNIVISIYLAKLYGVVGVAAGTAVSLVVGEIIIMGVYLHKYVGLNMVLFYKKNLRTLLNIVFVVCLFYLCRPVVDDWLTLFSAAILVNFTYAFLVWFIAFNYEDKAYVLGVVRSIVK